MTNTKFMCLADAIRMTQSRFDEALSSSVAHAVSRMSSSDIREAFFPQSDAAAAEAVGRAKAA